MNLSDSRTAGQPLKRVSAMEAVLSQLRTAIEEGAVQVGDKLPAESALSAEFGVSRAVVREALRGLQALGLTESRTGRGTFVVSARAAEHMSFTDAQVLLPQLDGDFTAMIGDIDPRRSLAAQRKYVAAFFDLHLRGRPTTVFDRPAYPEVELVP